MGRKMTLFADMCSDTMPIRSKQTLFLIMYSKREMPTFATQNPIFREDTSICNNLI